MIYPRRAKRERMNVRELPWWRSESYKRYVRGFACIVPGCTASPREACHIRFGTDGCKDEKPSDFFCYPACREHHAEQHGLNSSEQIFERKYGVSLLKHAEAIARGGRFHREIEEWKRTHNTRGAAA